MEVSYDRWVQRPSHIPACHQLQNVGLGKFQLEDQNQLSVLSSLEAITYGKLTWSSGRCFFEPILAQGLQYLVFNFLE